ncbi:hypothetical protein AB4Z54_48860, partial [Streptomyces sp. MCAF7]
AHHHPGGDCLTAESPAGTARTIIAAAPAALRIVGVRAHGRHDRLGVGQDPASGGGVSVGERREGHVHVDDGRSAGRR